LILDSVVLFSDAALICWFCDKMKNLIYVIALLSILNAIDISCWFL